jgi:hypothetical protein
MMKRKPPTNVLHRQKETDWHWSSATQLFEKNVETHACLVKAMPQVINLHRLLQGFTHLL